jgi:hypothetical protein
MGSEGERENREGMPVKMRRRKEEKGWRVG